MNPYYNLRQGQKFIHRLADQFNANECFWESLAPRRHARRHLLKNDLWGGAKGLKALDAPALSNCIGQSLKR